MVEWRWLRVSPRHPCHICHKGDWCTYTEDNVHCCMRIQSDHTAKNGGWLHGLNGHQPLPRVNGYKPKPVQEKLNCEFHLSLWRSQTTDEVDLLSVGLGVSKQALEDLDVCYAKEHEAYAFPMRDENAEIVGIRLRSDTRKWAVRGSKAALFLPMKATSRLSTRQVMICEGPTDTSAALSLGYFAIGRPACLGCEEMLATVLEQIGAQEAIICYDNDGPGIRGADKLATTLRCSVSRFVPPRKDLRAFAAAGGTRQLLQSTINDCISTRK